MGMKLMRNAECGMRSGKAGLARRSDLSLTFRTPHSAFRTLRVPFLTMSYETLLFEIRDGIAFLTINRPDKLNALNDQVVEELADAAERIAATPEIKGAILTGAGTKAFVAGADNGAPGEEGAVGGKGPPPRRPAGRP